MTSTISEDTRIPIKFLLAFGIPCAMVALFVIRKLDGIGAKLDIIDIRLTALEKKTDDSVSESAFQAWLREARARGFENLPPFLAK